MCPQVRLQIPSSNASAILAGVQSLDLNENIALEAARMQDQLLDDGERMATRDLLIGATARSTGAELVVADSDFEAQHLTDLMEVTNLRRDE